MGSALIKDFEWTFNNQHFVIKNVPYEKHDAEGEIFYDVSVSTTLMALRDLMVTGRINKTELDFTKFAHIKLEL